MIPQFQASSGSSALIIILSLLTTFVGTIASIFFIIVAWRAMRAHERIAEMLERRPGPEPRG